MIRLSVFVTKWKPAAKFAFLSASFAFLASCGGGGGGGPSRAFYLGINAWPYDNTLESVDRLYEEIQQNSDLIGQHLQLGIPWQAALDGSDYPATVLSEVSLRRSRTDESQVVFLTIDSLNAARNDLAGDWTEAGGNQPRTGAWETRGFADQEVADAYIRFASDMIEEFDPLYFNYAAEVSDLMRLDEAKFSDFIIFAERVYAGLKDRHSDVQILFSIAVRAPGSSEAQTIQRLYPEISDFTDILGLSIYPFVFFEHEDRGDSQKLPENWLSQMQDLDPDKALAITETGWPSADLVVPDFSLNISISEDDQQNYVQRLLEESDELNLLFVSWFSFIDYDALWEKALGDSVSLIWRNTGMLNSELESRPALEVWQNWLNYQRIP